MADIPLKSDDETTNDLVNAVENIAKNVKLGSVDLTKSFNGLTKAIKVLQTTLVNAIKAIKIQVVAKQDKVSKQPIKSKETITKESVKQKEIKTELPSQKEPRGSKKKPKEDVNVSFDEKVLKYISKNPDVSGGRIEKEIGSGEGVLSSPELKESLDRLVKQNKILVDQLGNSNVKLYTIAPNVNLSEKEPKVPKVQEKALKKPKQPKVEDPKVQEKALKEPKQPKVEDPKVLAEKELAKKRKEEDALVRSQKLRDQAQLTALRLKKALEPVQPKPPKEPKLKKPVKTEEEKQALAQEKKYKNEVEKRQQNLKPVKVSSLIEGINQVGDAWSKVISNVKTSIEQESILKQKEEENASKLREKAEKEEAKSKKDAADKAIKEEKRLSELKQKAEEDAAKAEKLLKEYFRKKSEKQTAEQDAASKEAAKIAKQNAKEAARVVKEAAEESARIAKEAAKEVENASKLKERAEKEADGAEKALRSYFRKKQEEDAKEASKAANDLVKEQERAAKELNAENQKVKKELDSLIAGFQSMTPLFRGPLVRYGLEMMAKGIGFKQPANELKTENQNVSYVGNVETESQMKPKGTDTQPAMLTPGEFVVNKKAYEKNKDEVEAINSGKPKKKTEYHAAGAVVGAVARSGASSAGTSAASSGAASGATSAGAGSAGGGGGGKNLKSIFESFDFSNFSKSMKSFFSKFPILGASTTALGIVFNSVTSSVKIANQALALFGQQVAKANPALMQKLDIVMNDLNGVIGRALIPSVEYLSPLFRKYADYVDYSMKRLTPAINKSAVAFDNLVSPLLDIGATIYSVLGPIFNGLATILVGLSNVIKPIIQFFSSLLSTIVTVVDVLSSPVLYVAMATLTFAFNAMSFVIKTTLGIIQTLLGAFVNIVGLVIKGLGNIISYIPFMGGVGKKIAEGGEAISKSGELLKKGETGRIQKGSSVGAAVREVSSTSIAGVGDEIRKNAMMAASGQRTQEDMLGDIANKLDKNALADAFADGIKKAGGEKPLATPPTPIQGQNPFASKPKDKVELGIV